MSRPSRIDDADAPIPRLDSGMRLGGFEAGGATSFRAAANGDVGGQEGARYRVHLPTPSWRTGSAGGPLSSTLRFGSTSADDRQSPVTQGSSRDLMSGPRRLSDHALPGPTSLSAARRRSASRASISQARHPDRTTAVQPRDAPTLDPTASTEVNPTPFPPPTYLRHSTFWSRFYTFAPSSYSPSTLPAASRGSLPARDPKGLVRREDGPSVLPLSTAGDFDDPGGPIGLPTHWDRDDKWHLLDVDSTGKRLRFLGSGQNGDRDAAACRANRAMPPQAGIYYFEVEIVSKGLSGFIGLGFCALEVKLSRLPGWEEQSWGYHGDDGHTFCSTGTGRRYGPQFTTGDTIGIGVDYTMGKAFFVKNGVMLGHVFSGLEGKMYPCCGLRTPGEEILANFGDRPFRFSIDSFVQARKLALFREICARPLPERVPSADSPSASDGSQLPPAPADSSDGAPRTLSQLVGSYLVHHGFTDTARAFEAQQKAGYDYAPTPQSASTGATIADEEQQFAARRRVQLAILNGDIGAALDELSAAFPAVLAHDDKIVLFKLHLQRFVELVVGAAPGRDATASSFAHHKHPVGSNGERGTDLPTAALDGGRTLFEDWRDDLRPSVQRQLRLAASLLAYGDPVMASGQAGRLASQEARARLADDVNSIIWTSQGRPARPAMETVVRHAHVVASHCAVTGHAALIPTDIA